MGSVPRDGTMDEERGNVHSGTVAASKRMSSGVHRRRAAREICRSRKAVKSVFKGVSDKSYGVLKCYAQKPSKVRTFLLLLISLRLQTQVQSILQ